MTINMKDKDLNFEKALAELEQTVEKLETGGLNLTESLGLFEKGVRLARYLRAELEKAEKRVELLIKDEKGNVRREPFSLDDEEKSVEGDAEENDDDHPREGGERKPRTRSGKKKADDGGDALPF
jgi:exodeoxyribonuclease VII small subunit